MVDDTDPRHVLRGIGRGLDECFPPDAEQPESFERLLNALREKEARGDRRPSN